VKLFMASLSTETNTFSPIPTGRASFMDRGFHRRDGSRHAPVSGNIPLTEWRRMAEAEDHEIVESLTAGAQPAGTTLRSVYEELRDMLLDDLRAAMPVDVVLLFMHGAMVADGYDDCEGDTLARVRAIVGAGATIGIELDLHCHLTERMRQAADVIITFKEYPHIDMADRARELYPLCLRAQRGEIRPVIAFHDCRIINMWRTPLEPMRSFVRRMTEHEGKGPILSVSFGHGFPWGDVADVGSKVVVVADGDADAAAALAARLGREIWEMREQAATAHDTIDAGIDAALAAQAGRPTVLADVADNAGGGAPADSTPILRRLVERGIEGVVIGIFWDPLAVRFAQEWGEGARMMLRIGGKCGAASGMPIDLPVEVRAVRDQHEQTGLSGGRSALGPSAWVRSGGIDIVLVSNRQQTFHPDAFTGIGLTLADKRIVVVKSTQHFYAGFAPIAREVRYVAAPGAIGPDFGAIPYTKLQTPYWPRVADPFA
jgi:microcystin degradation protein MlrC